MELSTLPDIDLARVGTWNTSTGVFTFTPQDLTDAVTAMECPAVRRPVIKLGHTDPRFDGQPAVGFVDALRVDDAGQTLRGDLVGVPSWLAEIAPSAYPDRSIEAQYDYVCAVGHTHRFVMTGIALLGVPEPAVGTLTSLQDVAALYTGDPAMTVNASASVEDVRRAYYDGPGTGMNWWISQVYVDPPMLIVQNDDDGNTYRVTYTVTGDGTESVTFDTPTRVMVEYVDAPTTDIAAKRPAAVYASRNTTQPAATATGTDTSETRHNVDTLLLRKALGLADDAPDTEVIAALAEHNLIPVPEVTPVTELAPEGDAIPVAAAAMIADLSAEVATIKAERARETRERVINDAVRAGKITPADASVWASRYDNAPAVITEVLAATAIGTAVPVGTVGVAGSNEVDADSAYAALFGTVEG